MQPMVSLVTYIHRATPFLLSIFRRLQCVCLYSLCVVSRSAPVRGVIFPSFSLDSFWSDSCSLDACCDHYNLPLCSGAAPRYRYVRCLTPIVQPPLALLALALLHGRSATHDMEAALIDPRLNFTQCATPLGNLRRDPGARGRRRHLTTREPVQALGLTRLSSRSSEPRLRVFCEPPLRIFQKRSVSSAAAETTVVPSGL